MSIQPPLSLELIITICQDFHILVAKYFQRERTLRRQATRVAVNNNGKIL